jgi:hypothetical protein
MKPQEIEKALQQLEGEARKGRRPGPHLARHVLLSLGAALSEHPGEAPGWVERAREAGKHLGEAWERAVQDELSLACGEFVQCVDPRFLSLPNYDMDYTRSARARLEDRLAAARELGLELEAHEVDMLGLADRVLESHEHGEGPGDADGAGGPVPPDRGG